MDEAYTPPPLPPWTRDRRVAALHDALAHVMADALSVTALAAFARWNVMPAPGEGPHAGDGFAPIFAGRVRAGRRAQDVVARRIRALGGPVALHASDPSEVPRWMLVGQSHDPFAETVLLAAGTHEFVLSVEAAVEVARDIPDHACMRAMTALARREAAAVAELRALAGAAAEAAAHPAATRH